MKVIFYGILSILSIFIFLCIFFTVRFIRRSIAEKNALIAEQDALIVELDAIIAEKNSLIKRKAEGVFYSPEIADTVTNCVNRAKYLILNRYSPEIFLSNPDSFFTYLFPQTKLEKMYEKETGISVKAALIVWAQSISKAS